jgi:hypothetical protein
MEGFQTDQTSIEPSGAADGFANVLVDFDRHRIVPGSRSTRPLRCVSSGYLSHGSSCPATIPTGVVAAAWARELTRTGVREDRFFHFSWCGGVWRAYGLHNGRIRGVYCPEHSAERHERALVRGSRAPAPVAELALSA